MLLLAALACREDPQIRTVFRTEVLTTTVTEQIDDGDLDPGHFSAPLQLLSYAEQTDKLHIEEVRYRESDSLLLYCSLSFGALDLTDPSAPDVVARNVKWKFDADHLKSGCMHLDWDDDEPDIVYVAHPGNVDFLPHLSVVDLAGDPVDAAPSLQEDGASYEGLDAAGGLLYVAMHDEGLGVYRRAPDTQELSRIGGDEGLVINAYDVQVVGTTAYVLDEQRGLVVLDVADPSAITLLGSLFVWGVHRDLRVVGDFAYLASGPAGLVIVDVSDPASPTLVSVTDMPGTATGLGVHSGRVAVAAWNDTRLFDVNDPAAPAFIGAVRLEQPQRYPDDDVGRPSVTARTFSADLYGDLLYVGNWNTPYIYRIHEDNLAPYAVLPEDVAYVGFGTVPVGQSRTQRVDIENHGTAPLTIYDVWTTSPSFAVRPSEARVPPGGEVEFTLTYAPTNDEREAGLVHFRMDDPSWPVREGYLVGNSPEIGVGDPFPYTEATDVFSGARWTSDQTLGQVTLLAYFATF